MRRAVLAVVLVLAAVAAGLVLGGEALLNTDAVRSRVAEAVQRATGHPVVLGGRIGLAWSAAPAVSVGDVTLLNVPGFSRQEFASVRRVSARVALVPLLSGRVEVPEVTIEGASLWLERDAQGRGNWLPPAVQGTPVPAGPVRERTPVVVGRVALQDAVVRWEGAPVVEVPRLVASPAGGAVEGRVVVRGVGFTVAGRTGAAERAPVAVELTAVGGGLALSVAGEAGGGLAVQVLVPELAALQGLAGRPLPALREVVATVQAGPWGWRALHVTAKAGVLAGVRLTRLDVAAAAMDQPVTVAVEGMVGALPVAGSLNLGSAAAVLGGGVVPFQALVLADGGRLAVQGSAAADGGRLDAAVTGEWPDLRRSGALAGVGLPGVRDVSLAVRLQSAPSGPGVLARGLRITSAQGDVAGDLALAMAPLPTVRGTLQSQRLDLDTVLASAPEGPAVAAGSAVAAVPAAPGPLIPERALPFAALRGAEADLRLAVAQATWRGVAWRAAEARVLLHDGRLRIDPAQVMAPGGPVSATFSAAAEGASAALVVRGVGLDAAALSGGEASGALDVDVELSGAGADLRGLVASAQGHAGVALVEGEVENQVLATLFGPVLRAAKLPVEAQGRTRVRCLAARVEPAGGVARVVALGLDATRLRLEGEGAINLVDETLDLHLRPTLRIGPTGVAIPVRLTGPLRSPRPELERGGIAPGRVGISIGGASADPCPGALAAARGRP